VKARKVAINTGWREAQLTNSASVFSAAKVFRTYWRIALGLGKPSAGQRQ
jgi:hypothetical protein